MMMGQQQNAPQRAFWLYCSSRVAKFRWWNNKRMILNLITKYWTIVFGFKIYISNFQIIFVFMLYFCWKITNVRNLTLPRAHFSKSHVWNSVSWKTTRVQFEKTCRKLHGDEKINAKTWRMAKKKQICWRVCVEQARRSLRFRRKYLNN